MNPQEALNKLCYTSQRYYSGTLYTISDCRFPEYDGKNILVTLEHGKNKAEWYTGDSLDGQYV